MTGGEHALRIALLGAGRMGRELIAAVSAAGGARLTGVWARDAKRLAADVGDAALAPAAVSGDLEAVLAAADVAIDFTLPGATPGILDAVLESRTPLVCGVSGLDEAVMRRMREVAASVPVFYDRNMSFGIAVLTDLVARAAAVLGPGFVAEIQETHHVHKVDAPSGTALKLGEALAAARGREFASVFRYAVQGAARRESADDIVFKVERRGEVPGDHAVVFRSAAETLELGHSVQDRRVFAEGALRAARWLVRQPPGLYRMQDVANLREGPAGGSTPDDAPVK